MDCSLCSRPYLTGQIFSILGLYKRCKQFNVLPRQGGVFDQREDEMALLEFIETEVQKWRAKREQDIDGEMMKQKMMQGLPRG